ncbi:protein DCL, chloroplastic-like [Cynara cardunculus var. scolymus]|uniref:Copper amine oxidase, N2/N3-terminal n=1 Tax=Cynara cardunculus var. scolymus TaxID=59895 RepID=A0A103YCM9_CYNCS|nr:protein DCL, chloroplastic-like [Cynara cardunculus var. scolymus]KVI06642.1 Copper amine oxidase, N2/N3-terminal [Cynara cardunculus var. scolymus]
MESISSSSSSSLHIHLRHRNLISLHLSSTNPSIISFPYRFATLHSQRFCALRTSSAGGGSSQHDGTAYGAADLLRKPVVEVKEEDAIDSSKDEDSDYEDDGGKRREEDGWVDWEDQILEDTVPLVGFVRMILHSGKYASGERLSSEHERTILERLLPHHPESEKKIGCGVNYITVGYHPDFESSRCLFIVRKDGEMVDFSYWKCIKGLIRKNYPLYADSFILRHFRRRRHNND